MNMNIQSPLGFCSFVTCAGIKDETPDVTVVVSEVPCAIAAVYTRSRFASSAVAISRTQAATGSARALLVTSKNANVATGPNGRQDSLTLIQAVSAALDIPIDAVQIAGTGVIGKRLPVDRIMAALQPLASQLHRPADFLAAATGIMTTDTRPKVVTRRTGRVTITGIAKGVGMIEPDMATLLTYFFTDVKMAQPVLSAVFKRVIDRTFNCISVDSDTSTSDSAAIFANGLAGEVEMDTFEQALHEVAFALMKMVVSDGEGVTKTLQVTVENAASAQQAKAVAKSIVNSPLVKTAVHGNDPNWGRIAMAVGKCTQFEDIVPEKTAIRIGGIEVFPQGSEVAVEETRRYMAASSEVDIRVSLGIGMNEATVWGCDLTAEYVRLNSAYTT